VFADRVCVYIDGMNLFKRLEYIVKRTDLAVEPFVRRLVGPERRLVRSYFYTAPLTSAADIERQRDQMGFFEYLRNAPYLDLRLGELRDREVRCAKCGERRVMEVQKGVDLALGVDMVSHAARNMYDVAILVSGDGDFVEAVRAVKDLGKHVEVAAFPDGLAKRLQQTSDRWEKLGATWFTPDLFGYRGALPSSWPFPQPVPN
jgi:uncharacterized LabA/DUF88 family protein